MSRRLPAEGPGVPAPEIAWREVVTTRSTPNTACRGAKAKARPATAQFGFVSPALIGFALSTEVLIWTAVGGRGVLLAAFLGALLVRSVEGVLSENLGNYWLLILGLLFVVTVVVAPRGLFGVVLSLPLPGRLTGRPSSSVVGEPET